MTVQRRHPVLLLARWRGGVIRNPYYPRQRRCVKAGVRGAKGRIVVCMDADAAPPADLARCGAAG